MRATFITVLLVSIAAAVSALPIANANDGTIAVGSTGNSQPVHRLVRRAWSQSEPEYRAVTGAITTFRTRSSALPQLTTARTNAEAAVANGNRLIEERRRNPPPPGSMAPPLPNMTALRLAYDNAKAAVVTANADIAMARSTYNRNCSIYEERTRLNDCPPLT